MAHATGSVNSLADLLTAIRNACTTNGWTLSGDVLHKDGTYVRIQEVSSALQFLGGTGIDGGNNLTGAGPQVVRIADFSQAITFPLTWEAHINTSPDEVYIVVNYNVEYYQYAAWGKSDVPGLTGSGVWYGASRFGVAAGPNDFTIEVNGGGESNGRGCPLFYAFGVGGATAKNSTFIHHDLDSQGWSSNVNGNGLDYAWSFSGISPLLSLQPNAWNSQTALLPFPVFVPRSSGNKVSLVADLKHIRHCRIDFHDPGDIITLGSDQWKLYPWYRKSNDSLAGGNNGLTHSGTVGFACRYTGS